MALAIVAQKKWAYTLYRNEGEDFILSVLCGGVGMYELNIPLSKEEGRQALEDSDFLERLAEDIRSHPENFSGKSVRL